MNYGEPIQIKAMDWDRDKKKCSKAQTFFLWLCLSPQTNEKLEECGKNESAYLSH